VIHLDDRRQRRGGKSAGKKLRGKKRGNEFNTHTKDIGVKGATDYHEKYHLRNAKREKRKKGGEDPKSKRSGQRDKGRLRAHQKKRAGGNREALKIERGPKYEKDVGMFGTASATSR